MLNMIQEGAEGMIVSPCVPQGLPDPQTVSSSIQQMWALTEVMQTNQTTASIGRFDVSETHSQPHLSCNECVHDGGDVMKFGR